MLFLSEQECHDQYFYYYFIPDSSREHLVYNGNLLWYEIQLTSDITLKISACKLQK